MISIIIPVYNVENYIKKCLQSIFDQTYQDWEIILIDDGSTDRSGEICDSFSNDERVTVIHQDNKGVSQARNTGLDCARGDCVTFVDPDDWLNKQALEEYVNGIKKGADIVACNIGMVSEDGKCQILKLWANKGNKAFSRKEAVTIFMNNSAIACNKCYKKELLAKTRFDPSMSYGEDTDFLVKVLMKIESIWLSDYCAYYYFYKRPGNVVSGVLGQKDAEYLNNNYKIYDILAKNGYAVAGVHRINVAIGFILEKAVYDFSECCDDFYTKCKRLAKYPPGRYIAAYLVSPDFSYRRRLRYFLWMISPKLWVKMKRAKRADHFKK